MTKKIILMIIASPIIILVEMLLFTAIAEFMRQPADTAVVTGVILICVTSLINFYLFKFIQKQFKKEVK